MYNWYNALNKPFLTPPSVVFPIAWTILYTMIALSAFFFLKNGFSKEKILPFSVFVVQLGLNLAWSPVFFGKHDINGAFLIVVLLAVFVLFNIILFYKYSKIAGILLIPYFIWVIFASYLNYEFIRLN